jgi:hypothetical protein
MGGGGTYVVLDEKHVKYCTTSFKFFTPTISAFRNNAAKLHLQSLHRSGEINNNVLQLRLLLDLQAVRCRSAATVNNVA